MQKLPSSADDSKTWTTNTGAPVSNNRDSLTAGKRGPVLLEDFHLIEKLANLDRERIPERVVHARGSAAKGVFKVRWEGRGGGINQGCAHWLLTWCGAVQVTQDVTDITMAGFLSEVGKETPLIARFSAVTHERGSPETLRDVRGFSVKMYTQEGNYDFVGNNMPVRRAEGFESARC